MTVSSVLDANALVTHHEEGGSVQQEEGGSANPIIDDEPDDEDPRERDAFEIEQAVMEFIDEPSILHDEYPESESDYDEEHVRERRRNNMRRGDGNLYYHQTFFNGIAFKDFDGETAHVIGTQPEPSQGIITQG